MAKRFIWLPELIALEALKYSSPGEFSKKSGGAYNAAIRLGVLKQVCSHMSYICYPWNDGEIALEALKYSKRSDFEKNCPNAYNAALRRGSVFLDTVCVHMEYVRIYWTDEDIYTEALKYSSVGEFQSSSHKAYCAAQERGILKQICAHMERDTRTWTDDELSLEALKYRTITDFRMGSPAYYTAWKRGILDRICVHMKPSSGSSYDERYISKSVKEFFPKAKKLRDMKVSICDKPYIFGFDIDIFIPTLMRGIEFDGNYHHSFDYMRKDKGKRFWSDEDIRNYHQIKDDWFATKGIQILHIKGEDWKNNRSDCIAQIEQFLGITGFMSDTVIKAA